MPGNKAVMNWSGGKDSSLTLYHVLKDKQYDVKYLVTSCSEEYDRISMHGVRVSLLKRQAELIGIPLKIIYVPTMPTMAVEGSSRTSESPGSISGMPRRMISPSYILPTSSFM